MLSLWIAVDSLPPRSPSLVSWWLELLVLLSVSLEIKGLRRNTIEREGWLSTPSREPRERGSLGGMTLHPPRMLPNTFFPCVGALTLRREIRVVPVWSSCASSFINLECGRLSRYRMECCSRLSLLVHRDEGRLACRVLDIQGDHAVDTRVVVFTFVVCRLRGSHPLPKKRHSPLAYLADPDCRLKKGRQVVSTGFSLRRWLEPPT